MAERKQKAAPLEWGAAAIGLLIFVGLFVTIFAQGTGQGPSTAPELVVKMERMIPAPGGTLVQFHIRNRSARTAAEVVIEGEVANGPEGAQKSQVTIDYVPARSSVTAGLLFRGDIRGRRVEIRPVGYRLP